MPSYTLEADVVLYLEKNEEDGSVSVRAQRVDGSGDAEIVSIRQNGTLHRVGNLATELGFVTDVDGFIKVNNPGG